ncbi:hypothetical protein Q7C36_001505 [Tachysurus vachellii]|uniref:Uncharacterized protein n=1 Tax=Tachysurus vachellii TaxID=175792 RepID=A0AA88PBV0_TACVA|nr:hypothetical protein Q7C36_001505 [Tachysurus vachellii]
MAQQPTAETTAEQELGGGGTEGRGTSLQPQCQTLNGGRIHPSNPPVTPPNSTGGLWECFQHPNFAPTLPPKEETAKLLPAFVFVSGLRSDTDAMKTVPTVRPCRDWFLSGLGSATAVPAKKRLRAWGTEPRMDAAGTREIGSYH